MKTALKIIFCLVMSGWVVLVSAFFEHDKAAYAGQNQAWEQARSMLTPLIIDHSDDPTVLYDVGVASYKLQEYDHARAYFDAVSASDKASAALKEQAYFNAGNAAVQQKKLQEAIDKYEQVLTLNKNNEPAQHNLDVVKKMLEQQKQQDQQNKKQDQKEDTQKDKQKDQQQDNKDQQKDQQDQQKNQDKKEGKQQDGGSSSDDNNEGSDEQKDQKQQNGGHDEGQEKKSDTNNQHGRDQQDQQKDRSDAKQSAEREQQKKENEQSKNDQQTDAQQKKDAGKKNKQKKEQRAGDGQQGQEQQKQASGSAAGAQDRLDKVEAWLADILEKREQDDAQLNKQMIKATVGKQLAGQHGQNCW